MTDKEKIEMLERENKMLREQIMLYKALEKAKEKNDKELKGDIIKEYIPYPIYPYQPTVTYTDKTFPFEITW